MLPGHVAGHYRYDDIHIDLAPLARAAGVRLIVDAAVHIDVHGKRVDLERHTSLRFDVLSLNCGAAPGLPKQSAPTPAIPVKPIGGFLPRWRELLDALQQRSVDDRNVRIVIVGGGAGGVELALAVHHALVLVAPSARMVLVTASAQLLDGHAAGVRRRFTALLKTRGIDVLTQFVVVDADARGVTGSDGRRVPGELVLWVTGVAAPPWLADSGLALDAHGFVAVDRTLRSTSHAGVFAAGDVASMVGQSRPKAGVFAVRQAPVLADNLRRALLRLPLREYRAQQKVLALISEGDRTATASRGALFAHGAWVWRWKDRIDRRFMARFKELQPPRSDGAGHI